MVSSLIGFMNDSGGLGEFNGVLFAQVIAG